MRTDNPPDRVIHIIDDMICLDVQRRTLQRSISRHSNNHHVAHRLQRRILCSSRIMKKTNPCHAIQNGGGTIAPAITSHYFKAGVRDFLFALAIPHCCLIVEYE